MLRVYELMILVPEVQIWPSLFALRHSAIAQRFDNKHDVI
jgi:hypothetical protein